MGRSTTQELIAKGKNENKYNNSGITNDGIWVDFFNDALADLVDDIGLTDTFTVDFEPSEREYDLPSDFYGLFLLTDERDSAIAQRRNYNALQGYWTMNKGDGVILDLYKYTNPQTFKGVYYKYPAKITLAGIATEYPQVPSVGERALIYYALAKALRNNAQTKDAAEMEAKYEEERKKIRTAAAKARGYA